MKRIFLFFATLVLCNCGIAQDVKPKPDLKPIPITISKIAADQQFSAIAWKGDVLFMVAQKEKHKFYYVTKKDIEKGLKKKKGSGSLKLRSIDITGLIEFSDSLGECDNEKQEKIPVYDGIEGCVIIGNSIYVSIEARKGLCYILKGNINKKGVHFDSKKCLPLNKPGVGDVCDNNYGFESLVQLNDTCIMTLFELHAGGNPGLAWSIDTNLNKTPMSSVSYFNDVERPPRQRIADVCRYDDTTFYGIDFLYRAEENKELPCYSKLVKFTISQGSVNISYVADLLYTYGINCINFEGMVRFGEGLLLISDDVPSDDQLTHLYYYPFK